MSHTQFETFADYYRNGAYSRCRQEHRSGGSLGLSMIEVEQDAGDYVDLAFPQVGFVEAVQAPNEAFVDFGNGRRRVTRSDEGGIGPQPANIECRFQMDSAHRIRVLAVDIFSFSALTERSGIRGDPLDAMYAGFFHDPCASVAFHRLWELMQRDDPAASLAVDGAFLTFLAHYLPSAGTPLSIDWMPGAEDARLRRVIDYIEANLGQQLLMDELASVACLSTSHFARVFRETLGRTAHRYVTERRIERAKSALATSRDPVTLIALDCGFGSSAHFATVFRQHVGLSPSAYRVRGH